MPNDTAAPIGPAQVLPPPPSTVAIREAAVARLEAIGSSVLPELRNQRSFLERLWYADGPDAVLIHMKPSLAIPCAPAGADRLASAVADEQTVTREEMALRDLLDALEDYESGGRLTRAELEDNELSAPTLLLDVRRTSRPAPPPDHEALDQARRLAEYEALLERELLAAVASGQTKRAEALKVEQKSVHTHLGRYTRQGIIRPLPTCADATADEHRPRRRLRKSA